MAGQLSSAWYDMFGLHYENQLNMPPYYLIGGYDTLYMFIHLNPLFIYQSINLSLSLSIYLGNAAVLLSSIVRPAVCTDH